MAYFVSLSANELHSKYKCSQVEILWHYAIFYLLNIFFFFFSCQCIFQLFFAGISSANPSTKGSEMLLKLEKSYEMDLELNFCKSINVDFFL